jgi:hypothetical protein
MDFAPLMGARFSVLIRFFLCGVTVRAVDPFGQPFRPTGVQLPGWDFAFLALSFFTFASCQGLTLYGFFGGGIYPKGLNKSAPFS